MSSDVTGREVLEVSLRLNHQHVHQKYCIFTFPLIFVFSSKIAAFLKLIMNNSFPLQAPESDIWKQLQSFILDSKGKRQFLWAGQATKRLDLLEKEEFCLEFPELKVQQSFN